MSITSEKKVTKSLGNAQCPIVRVLKILNYLRTVFQTQEKGNIELFTYGFSDSREGEY